MILLKRFLQVCTPALALCVAVSARADEPLPSPLPHRLVNLDTPAITPPHLFGGRVDLRFLSDPESITYTSLALRYGLLERLEIGVRAATGATRDFPVTGGGAGVIRHGGQDVELYGKAGMTLGSDARVSLAALVGVSFPRTPAQNEATVTLGGAASFRAHERVTLVLNPRATLQDSNVTVGIGLGAHVTLAPGLSLLGDWTGIVTGDNTRRTSDGSRDRRDVWGAALEWSGMSGGGNAANATEFALALGWSNATGSTTGFSLTPGLGRSSGFYLALMARR